MKEFAGHSKYSYVTPRYISVSKKKLAEKVFKERGVEVTEATKEPSPLTVKMCPRCKNRNSPTFNFCSNCSTSLDTKTMFEVQRKGELVAEGTVYPIYDDEHARALK